LDLCNFRYPGIKTSLEEDDDCRTIEKPVAFPEKDYVNAVTSMHGLDTPEWFWHKVLHLEIPIDDKTKSWKLA